MSMSAPRHAWVSLRRSSLPRQRWFIVILALLGGCVLAMNTIVAGHVRDQIDAADVGKRLNYVVVDSSGRGSNGPIDAAARQQIMAMNHVAGFYEWSQAGLLCDDDNGLPQIVWATAQIPDVPPVTVAFDGRTRPLRSGEVIVPDAVNGRDLKALLGTTINVSYQRKTKASEAEAVPTKLKVVGLYDSSRPNNDGPDTVYINVEDAKKWEAANAGMSPQAFDKQGVSRAYVEADSRAHVADVHRQLSQAGFAATSQADVVGYADQMTSDTQRMQIVLIVVICLSALVLGVSVGSTISRQRGSQIAVFKAFGRSGEWILGCLEMEAFLLGVVMALAIVVVGLVLCGAAMALTAAGVHLGPVAMTLVPLPDVLKQGAWFPLLLVVGVPLGCLPRTVASVRSHKPYELLRSQ
ncbi:ABC transporter permease [Cutibacterium equinum]|uniref:ABC transporter permease n=1 Tax=Cutibacterium equinum TaxID=3016342 RepID=A0ABY7QX12_9ACTN|nr:ABC transporter permease [Cutibacterium equinum]WCC79585.1 ABC transporter permease [Cutibacterium equinum]